MNLCLAGIARSSHIMKTAAYGSGFAFDTPSEAAFERSPIHFPDLTDEIVYQGILSPFQRSKIMRARIRSRNNVGCEVIDATVGPQRRREWVVSVGGNTIH
ncbi:hypothetical protein EXN24_25740 [Rhizobium rhizogenes]|jgi:hypothetical protein|uniref:Uncharacterized protein n=1 Tax=Rhizobium rhizogenes TaxID=359 RepID=A0AA94V8P6_RHIRH|nr:hypothetical protein EXN24_25740 [Rhizobium rhizogenes]